MRKTRKFMKDTKSMKNNLFTCAAMMAALTISAYSPQAFAQNQTGRQLDVISTQPTEFGIPVFGGGFLGNRVPVVGIFWDQRCASVEYTLNSNVGANPGTAAEVTPTQIRTIVQRGLNRWNNNPSSYIDMNITNVTNLGNRPVIGGDFINEVSFITPGGFGALASSPSVSLTEDTTFLVGEDLDLDGDPDVFDPAVEGINTCSDVDGDCDNEFPAGFYKTGTILDNDVQFSSTVLWETTPGSNGAADIDAVSTHEFGHSHGLSHSFINQTSDTDGNSSTMFPFISTDNAFAEQAGRSLHRDDRAASAFIYQEGVSSGTEPITQIQPGDIRFGQAYSVVRGSIEDSFGDPIAGAAVHLRNVGTGARDVVAYSGATSAFEVPPFGCCFVDASEAIVDGRYEVPALEGRDYIVEIEALDGDPAAAGNISIGAQIADIAGLTNFREEDYSGDDEAGIEVLPITPVPVTLGRSNTLGIDFVLNDEETQETGDLFSLGTGAVFFANDISYVEMFNRNEVLSRIEAGEVPVAGLFRTSPFDNTHQSVVLDEVQLAIGRVNPLTGNAEIVQILTDRLDVEADDSDETVVRFKRARFLPNLIRLELLQDPDAHLFLIGNVEDAVIGTNNTLFPVGFVGLSGGSGTAFLGLDGGPLTPRTGSTWAMGLSWTTQPTRRSFIQPGAPVPAPNPTPTPPTPPTGPSSL